ncbi:MAG: hypothetical protein ACKODX_21625 [Gemmata sp.]
MLPTQRHTTVTTLFLVLTAFVGCDKTPAKPVPVAVGGTVTLDGQLLAEGTVYFKTVATGAFDTLPVKGGKFEGMAEVGERRVEINAYRIRKLTDDPMGGTEVKESIIPSRYNAESTLTATVTAQGPNAFKFEVKTK